MSEENKNLSAKQASIKESSKAEGAPDMEVHHHTHASHGKKTWKNWLLKCLLYLLVGFISAFIYRQMKN